MGSGLGVVLAVVHQLVQLKWSQAAPSSFGERVVAVLLMGVSYGAVFLVAASLAGLLLGPRPILRHLALFKMGLVATCLVLAHLLAEALYLRSGSHLTLGALEFFSNSMSHMLRALFDGYLMELGLVLAVALALGGLLSGVSRSTINDPFLTKPRLASASLVGIAVLLVVGELIARDDDTWDGVWDASVEFAFVQSVYLERSEEEELESKTRLEPEAGRLLNAERLWDTAMVPRDNGQPNVLLLMLESVSASHLGYGGYGRQVTPNIDRIAKESLSFTRAWTTATHSNYAQMAVLSSLFPRRTTGLDTYKRLDYPRVLLHDFLYELGYETATVSSQDETWQGMDRFQDTGTPTLFFHARHHQGPLVHTGTERVVPDELTAQRAIGWIAAQNGRPWGLYVNFQMTHFPYKLPQDAPRPFTPWRPDARHFKYLAYPQDELGTVLNKYDNALSYVDRQVGRLYDYLRDANLLDRTIFVITSDHGELFHQHGMVTHGRSLYDAEARVPLLMRYPAKLGAGETREPVSHLDVLPTIADLLEVPPHPSFQGTSVLGARDFSSDGGGGATSNGRRAIFMNNQGMRSADAIVCWPYKLIKDRQKRRPELYRLDRDPDEERDLFVSERARATRLQKLLRAQMRAQLRYHHPSQQELRDTRYAPRLLSCDAALTGPEERSRAPASDSR